ncbi:hypothetical protein [Nonomuraea turcica]|uniref:hypothetical protein n=1 Tax=Nonomuraea sp. G32 TaxID=3067274 RepID=UPI00273BBBFA|nr:hypothetical protein [Nonomuraea sp. G32]MDP4510005.1 hypothetical protein [Nonomuraea sp. G32]
MFGNRYRLEVLEAFASAPEGQVNLGRLAVRHGVQSAVYYPVVRDLLALRMVSRVTEVGRDRRRWYRRTGGDALWEPLGRLVAGLRGHYDLIAGDGLGRHE